ncbi:hypothetical protein BLNAU_7059 [Blattamonas nauphoetae]|uniref:Zn(2)-C6 fungal-type domain-containing protein n=1 Tax=Blattamonas nauphoetae TaxID=2049346 RepID=A0ABQ9Y2B7_9EUKA|nr:hypothetical protein BLNAU_7059 [Blattamonas nauphoetae]
MDDKKYKSTEKSCDSCRLRGNPCSSCVEKKLVCTYDMPVKKRGPNKKRNKGRKIRALSPVKPVVQPTRKRIPSPVSEFDDSLFSSDEDGSSEAQETTLPQNTSETSSLSPQMNQPIPILLPQTDQFIPCSFRHMTFLQTDQISHYLTIFEQTTNTTHRIFTSTPTFFQAFPFAIEDNVKIAAICHAVPPNSPF